ncbi:hypothetical protein F5Y08DRAFT_336193 [Xylaria arbuscula]|nr:hypothetical protein F5Y08DRAFT_336193 [Xylaria arbuscula]
MAATLTPYFPRSGSTHASSLLVQQLPPPPKVVGPVFDEVHAKEPIPAFNEEACAQHYPGLSESGEALLPPSPVDFSDPYLVPTLARNERLRLTLLWYHTKDVEKDEGLMSEINVLVRSAQKFVGWEYAIAGIVNESSYRRLATVGLPLALLPRRESTCSHTINQAKLDDVFMILDMAKDWRFRHSPHSEIGGLRSYAGAPLRLTADDGTEVPLGSLCVASDTPQEPLKPSQRESLISFSELISTAIASHTQRRRLKKRQEMNDILGILRTKLDADNYEEGTAAIIQKAYPGAHVALHAAYDGLVPVKGRPAIKLSDVEGGLWEDTALIEQTIMAENFDELHPSQTVRAIVARCGSSETFVIVSGLDIHHVFDNFDAWFIFKAAAIISDILQNRLLRQALAAKETFLRGITHQLRTPIHGVLSSAELLAEELNARGLLTNDIDSSAVSPYACISTIRNSGQELMRTVNSILKYNAWADTTRRTSNSPYDLRQLEKDILPDSLSHIIQDHLPKISVEFRNELKHSRCLVTNSDLLKDCLREILLNAIQSVAGRPAGLVIFTIRDTKDANNLIFDIVDNGVGIGAQDHSSIFQPFYKVDSFKLGAGLGLTLARHIATGLQGTVTLVASSTELGSHFRVEFKQLLWEESRDVATTTEIRLRHLPRTFHWKSIRTEYSHFTGHMTRFLEFNKFRHDSSPDCGLLFADSDIDQLRASYPTTVIIILGRDKKGVTCLGPGLFYLCGPLYTGSLKKMLLQSDILYRELAEKNPRHNLGRAISSVNGASVGMIVPSAAMAKLKMADSPPLQRDCADQPVKALLVDDNPINLRILKMFCNKRKIPFATAEDGNIAIEQFIRGVENKEPFTLVLMDLQMPNCDGLEATRAIRAYEHKNALPRCIIFMVTGQDWGRDKTAAQEAGIDVFLIKPVSPKILDTHIAKFFTALRPGGG